MPSGRQALVVVGMHRSGTSAVTRLVSLLGADLPRRLMRPVAGVNTAGFWEPVDLVDLNDGVLASAGSFWDDVSEFPPSWYGSDTARAFREKVLEALRQDFARSSLFVLKDPRICRLLPFWIDVLSAFGAEPSFIVPIRNPLAVAASLKARNGFLPARSHLLWLRHLLEAERHTRGRPRCFLAYEDLVRDWRPISDRLARTFDLEWPRRSHLSEVEIERFLSEKLSHHTFSAADVEAHEEVPDGVRRAYRAALEAARQDEPDLAEVFDAVRSELDAADRIFGTLVVEGRLRGEENETLRRRLVQHEDLKRTLLRQHREIERLGTEVNTLQGQTVLLNQQVATLDMMNKKTREEVEHWSDRWQRAETDAAALRNELRIRQEGIERSQTELTERDAEIRCLREQQAADQARYSELREHASRLEKKVNLIRKVPFVEKIWRLRGRGSAA